MLIILLGEPKSAYHQGFVSRFVVYLGLLQSLMPLMAKGARDPALPFEICVAVIALC